MFSQGKEPKHGFKVWKITSRRMIIFPNKRKDWIATSATSSQTVLRSMEFIGLKHKSKPARMKRWRKRGPFSTVYGISGPTGISIFIPTGNAPMQIGSGCENQGIKVWDCPPTWMPVRWNAGWTRLMNEPIREFLKRSGRNIIPIQEPFAMRPRGSILQLFAGPSGPGRVGPL